MPFKHQLLLETDIRLPKNRAVLLIAAIFLCGARVVGAAVAGATERVDYQPIEFTNLEALQESAAACDNGAITFAWSRGSQEMEADVVLEQSLTPGFEKPVVRYRGSDPGSVISGLAEGTHYFRVRDDTSTSSVIEVRVIFFPKNQLYWLISTGGAVVLATLGVVVFGYCKTHRAGDDSIHGKEVFHAE